MPLPDQKDPNRKLSRGFQASGDLSFCRVVKANFQGKIHGENQQEPRASSRLLPDEFSKPPRIAKLSIACRCRFSLSLSLPTLVAEFYDAAVSGADPIQDRPGFAQLLDRIHATRLTSPHPLSE